MARLFPYPLIFLLIMFNLSVQSQIEINIGTINKVNIPITPQRIYWHSDTRNTAKNYDANSRTVTEETAENKKEMINIKIPMKYGAIKFRKKKDITSGKGIEDILAEEEDQVPIDMRTTTMMTRNKIDSTTDMTTTALSIDIDTTTTEIQRKTTEMSTTISTTEMLTTSTTSTTEMPIITTTTTMAPTTTTTMEPSTTTTMESSTTTITMSPTTTTTTAKPTTTTTTTEMSTSTTTTKLTTLQTSTTSTTQNPTRVTTNSNVPPQPSVTSNSSIVPPYQKPPSTKAPLQMENLSSFSVSKFFIKHLKHNLFHEPDNKNSVYFNPDDNLYYTPFSINGEIFVNRNEHHHKEGLDRMTNVSKVYTHRAKGVSIHSPVIHRIGPRFYIYFDMSSITRKGKLVNRLYVIKQRRGSPTMPNTDYEPAVGLTPFTLGVWPQNPVAMYGSGPYGLQKLYVLWFDAFSRTKRKSKVVAMAGMKHPREIDGFTVLINGWECDMKKCKATAYNKDCLVLCSTNQKSSDCCCVSFTPIHNSRRGSGGDHRNYEHSQVNQSLVEEMTTNCLS